MSERDVSLIIQDRRGKNTEPSEREEGRPGKTREEGYRSYGYSKIYILMYRVVYSLRCRSVAGAAS